MQLNKKQNPQKEIDKTNRKKFFRETTEHHHNIIADKKRIAKWKSELYLYRRTNGGRTCTQDIMAMWMG